MITVKSSSLPINIINNNGAAGQSAETEKNSNLQSLYDSAFAAQTHYATGPQNTDLPADEDRYKKSKSQTRYNGTLTQPNSTVVP